LRLSTLPAVGSRHHKSQRGFTLLEMLLVIFLMALVASTGLMLTEGVEDQAKYDETKRRMELIRKAIVGDPARTVNGAPELSGFVADMGRLPNCLRELTDALDCTSPGNALTTSAFDSNSGLVAGWRGPYLVMLPDSDGVLRLRDGYQNDDGGVDFGWGFLNDGTQIQLQSFGLNSVADGATPVDDYPVGATVAAVTPLVNPFDFNVTFQSWGSITIRFANTGAGAVSIAQNSLRLVLSYADDSQPGAIGKVESASFPAATMNVPVSGVSVAVTNGQTLTVPTGTTLNLNQVSIGSDGFIVLPSIAQLTSSAQLTLTSPFAALPDTMGHFSLSIVCNDPANPNAVDGKRFDGDCTRYGTEAVPIAYTPTNQPYLFQAMPRSVPIGPPAPLRWSVHP
ncbi:type II secretion system protein, partial [Methylomonas methanica]|uniref:type II secretion system protein n=1 Tax=Methylomonas methanica TaxID=421 RepID=UPI000ACBEB67